MKRVKVDFSTTVKGGLIRANQARADEPLDVGDEIEAFDPTEEMEFVGVVDHLSDDRRFAFLRMQWEDSASVPCNAGQNLFIAALFGEREITVRTHAWDVSSDLSGDQSEFVSPSVEVALPAPVFTTPDLQPAHA